MSTPETEPDLEQVRESSLAAWVRRVEEVLFAVILLGMIVAGLIPIFSRRFLPVGLTWPDPFTRQMVLWVALLGAGAATQERSHIAVDAVTHFLPQRGRSVVQALTHLGSAVLCGAFACFSVAFVKDIAEFEGAKVAFLGMREWWLALILPISFALLTLRLGIAAAQDALNAARKPDEEGSA